MKRPSGLEMITILNVHVRADRPTDKGNSAKAFIARSTYYSPAVFSRTIRQNGRYPYVDSNSEAPSEWVFLLLCNITFSEEK